MTIIINRKVMHGKPIVKGTRIPVDLIVGSLAGGMTYGEVCKEYGVKKSDILDCLKYVAELAASEKVYPLKKTSRRKIG
ncbi:MAG: DUF433 domain-containing protein [Candidatus Brocadiales bacterium]